jgi:hypothetical protein
MKRILFTAFIISLILSTNVLYSQNTDYPIHLFIGEFTRATTNDTTVETWYPVNENELSGNTIYTYSGGSLLSEIMRLVYINGKLNYCATVLEQDPDNPQSEVCFELKSYKNLVFTFENLRHDSPKRIIYDFNNWHIIKARVEDDSKGYDLEYMRDFDIFKSYTLKGTFIKEPFENKVNEIVDGIYDYFFKVQGIKYFIKFKNGIIKKEDVDKVLNKDVKASFIIYDGLWDADDNTHQSRIGKYISITNIY